MSRRSDPPNDPMAKLDTVRCDTRALDVGALRAIHAAYSTGVERGAASVEPIVDAAGAPANDTRPEPAARAPSALVGNGGASGPGGAATTLEVDYSPAARRVRTRSAKVQRAARIATVASLGAAALLGVWAVAGRHRDRVPLAVQAPVTAAPPLPAAPVATVEPPLASGTAPAATAETGVSATRAPEGTTPATSPAARRPSAWGTATAAPSSTPPSSVPPGLPFGGASVAPPGSAPSVTVPSPGGTVSLPILE